MGEITNQGLQPVGGFDLSQFYAVFFEEANENLASFESLLLDIDPTSPQDEDLNAIFRAAHSIKGGAATFGFVDVTELTHELETLLDLLRKHEIVLTDEMVDCLLRSGDALKAQLKRHQDGGVDEPIVTSHLISELRRLASGAGQAPAASAIAGAPPATTPRSTGTRTLRITLGPVPESFDVQTVIGLFDEIPGMGSARKATSTPQAGFFDLDVETTSPDGEILDLFTFYIDKDKVNIQSQSNGPEVATPSAADRNIVEDAGFGLFDAPASAAPAQPAVTAATPAVAAAAAGAVPVQAAAEPPKGNTKAERASAAAANESTTLRVAVEKIDQLINLVGELVITQSMLAQKAQALDAANHHGLLSGLGDLERNTRDLQESVMGIRMIPMSFVFNRFPRMLRDLANKLGKKVELRTSGEATELDKGLIEKITDPLTHLVRNSVDHGIEMPDVRLATGKEAHGTITLSAQHQGGSIVIEVRDDGRGLSRPKILAKAQERGIPVSDKMTDQEVWQLIFAPGFSTAEVVTDVSGRGVGMDVVKRNITALGGTVELDSVEGLGTRVSVRLPLTLAIMDGMSVASGDEIYILPLAAVVETFQLEEEKIKSLADQGKVVRVRQEYLPVRFLGEMFGVPEYGQTESNQIMVILEADERRTALVVDRLIGQHQVVVKNLESNYRKVPGISGATILGDGRVGLILDPGYLATGN